MSIGATKPRPTSRIVTRLGVAAATLAIVCVASVGTQLIVFGLNGVPVEWNPTPTPGVLGVLCAFVMAAACKRWETWRRWIWLPVAVTVVATAALFSFAIGVDRALEDQQVAAEAELCREARDQREQLATAHAEIIAVAADLAGPTPFPREEDWVPTPPNSQSAIEDLTCPNCARAAWDYYVANAGPELHTEIELLDAAIEVECP